MMKPHPFTVTLALTFTLTLTLAGCFGTGVGNETGDEIGADTPKDTPKDTSASADRDTTRTGARVDPYTRFDVDTYIGSRVPTYAGADTSADAGRDAGADAGADASADASRDADADAGRDASRDTGPDAGADAGADMGVDAGTPWVLETEELGVLVRADEETTVEVAEAPEWSTNGIVSANFETPSEETYSVIVYENETAARAEVGDSFVSDRTVTTASGHTGYVYETNDFGAVPVVHVTIPTENFVYYFHSDEEDFEVPEEFLNFIRELELR